MACLISLAGSKQHGYAVSNSVMRAASAPRIVVKLPISVDTVLNGELDATLGRPQLLTVSDSLIVFFDYNENRLSAIDFSGHYRWRVGRRGQGPGEWANPTALAAANAGGVLVHDGGNARLVRIDASGKITRSLQITSPLQRLGKLSDGRWVAFGGSRGRPVAELLDTAASIVRTLPWAVWPDSAAGLGSQLRVASGASGAVVAVSIYTGRMMPVRPDLTLDWGASGIDPKPLPVRVPVSGSDGTTFASVAPDTKPAIRDAAIVGNQVFVLAAGQDIGGRMFDVYDLPTMKYRASIRVPLELNVVASGRYEIVATSNDPYPVIVRIRWNEQALREALKKAN